jgi:PAS domain S-box-containing protein
MAKKKEIHAEDILTRLMHYVGVIAIVVVTILSVLLRSIHILISSYTIIGTLSLGIFVYLRGRDRKINVSFLLFCTSVAIWAFAVFVYSFPGWEGTAIYWSKFASFVSSLIPVLFLYFVSIFPKEERAPSALRIFFWAIVASVFCVLSFTDLIVKDIIVTEVGAQFVPGPGLMFFAAYFVLFMGYAFYVLLSKHNLYSGIGRMQIRYVLLGIVVGIMLPVFTNLILPVFGIVEFSGYGPFSTLVAIAFIAYAVVKHRLMSIELVLQRGLIYGIITMSIVTVYVMAILLSERYFREVIGYSSFILTGVAALIIAVLYQPFLRFLQGLTDEIFFRRRYDFQKTLGEASLAIASIIRLEQLTKLIVSIFTDAMAVSEISFLLYDKNRNRYRSSAVELRGQSRYRKIEIDAASPIIVYLKETKEILIKEELEGRILRAKSAGERKFLMELMEEMDSLGVPLWVPILFKDELIGAIASGNKLSGEIFTTEDLGLLSTLANQAAVALENVRLYEEIVSMKTYSEDILKSMTNGVLTTDMKGVAVTLNAMGEKLSGFSASDVVGQNVKDIWGEGVLSSIVSGTLRGEHYFHYETNLIKKDGSVIPVSTSTTLLRDSKGKSIGVLAVVSDLSEVKELEGKVRQADKLAALGTMAAGMAHEIKNPLSSMKVLSQLMPLKFEEADFRKRFIDIMPREIGRIDRIVESLLGFARAAAPKFQPVELSAIIEENLKFFEDDIERRGIKVVKKFSKVPDVTADAGQLGQVFSNLLLNAVQAMPKGGELKIVIKGVLEGVLVEVSDTGHGIPEEYLKKLFDPFFTTKHGGTGLGLTIAHSIIDGHKGSIVVDSRAEEGTTFKVSLPVSQ